MHLACADHEALRPTLNEVATKVKPVVKGYASLEQRTTALLQGYNDYVRLYFPLRTPEFTASMADMI